MAGRISDKDSKRYLERALMAAEWFVNSQTGTDTHRFNADRGRFLYYYFIPEKKHVPGINWTQGRALFVLSEAYSLTKDKRFLESAEFGARYVAALQIMDPFHGAVVGAIRERIPQDGYCGVLDGAQAATGLLMLEKVTGKTDYLRRVQAFCDFLLRHFSPEEGMPDFVDLDADPQVGFRPEADWSCIKHCSAITLWHLFRRTGNERYLPPLIYAADHILKCQRSDGAFNNCSDIRTFKHEPKPNHHWGRGEGDDRYLLRNDDGIVTVVLAAHQHTGNKRYLDAMVAYADWIVENEPHERPFCGFPIQADNVLDIGRAAGKHYSQWVLDNLDEHLLKLQVTDSDDLKAKGGFRGEDEEDEGGIFGGASLDYVPTRTTCYAAGTLFRLSGKGTGSGFSVHGLG